MVKKKDKDKELLEEIELVKAQARGLVDHIRFSLEHLDDVLVHTEDHARQLTSGGERNAGKNSSRS